jgi:predicted nucleotidyltransferase
MVRQIEENSREDVFNMIAISVTKLQEALSINLSNSQFAMLCNDIIDKYKHDSIEDVIICLQNARQGKYDWGHEKRGILNMVIISYWMSFHLDDKAAELEKRHANEKKVISENEGSADLLKAHVPKVDYEAYKARMKKEKEDPARRETEFQLFKKKYFESINKKGN